MFRKIGRLVVYAPSDLDAWAASRMSAPMASTSDHREVA
jgi:predicted DNA-binding transcriptional regulator AlpA